MTTDSTMDAAVTGAITPADARVSAPSRAWLDAPAPALTGVDAHAHIFVRGLPLAAARRHAPDYDATLDSYVAHLAAHGLSHGVLVQPSFLGTDNRYLADISRRYPQRFRAVAVVDPQASAAELETLAQSGVVGTRLNLIGLPLPDLTEGPWPRFLARVNALGWHVEVHRHAADLPVLLDALLAQRCTVVVDHFGRVAPGIGASDPGFRYLLSKAHTGNVWVKLSAAYRNASGSDGASDAVPLAAALLHAFGPERLVWGSDWPNTQHRHLIDYASAAAALARWVPDEATRHTILTTSARTLFRF
jgi:predicted TIM-barrel fold metal-dependent hydrolase